MRKKANKNLAKEVKMKTQTIKNALFIFLIHTLSVINMLLCAKNLTIDEVWLALQIFICIITIPIYFFVKNTPTNKWIYTLTSLVLHVVFTFLVCLVLGNIFNGWDNAIIYWTEIFLSVTFGVVILIDIIVNVIS